MIVNAVLSATTDIPPSANTPAWRTSAADASLLLQAALVGSSQPLQLPGHVDPNDPVALLLRQVQQQALQDPSSGNSSNSGNHLLRLAGAWAWCKRAGQIPPSKPSEVHTLSAPPTEVRPVTPPAWVSLLQQALSLDQPRLHAEVLQGMNQKQYRAPTEQLSTLFNLGRQTTVIRPFIQAVLGERGRWLGSLNRDWAWAQGAEESADVETLWAHGSLEQRLQVLSIQRTTDPKAARERLMAVWTSLPAKERHALLNTLTVGLSADDEGFLDLQLQKDRGAEVRRTAADLLAALPHSAYGQRMAQRLADLVYEKNIKNKLVVKAPAEPPAVTDAKGQAIGTHPTHLESEADHKTDWPDAERSQYDTLGPRAWLLLQFVRRSSLSWWTAHTGLAPAELVKQAEKSDWAEALIRGWLHACIYQADPEWILALLQHGKAKHWGDVEQLLSHLPQDARDDHQLRQWSADTPDPDRKKLLKQASHWPDFLKNGLGQLAAHAVWSERLSAHVALVLQTAIAEKTLLKELEHNYYSRELLMNAGCALHPQHLTVLQSLPMHLEDQGSGFNDCLRSIHHIVTLRLKLQELGTASG